MYDCYAIKYSSRDGKIDRIFHSWEDASFYIEGYVAVQKKFNTDEEAKTWFKSFTPESLEKAKRKVSYFRMKKHGVKIGDELLIDHKAYDKFAKLALKTNRNVIDVIQSCLHKSADKIL